MNLIDILLRLTKHLYPTGRAFRLPIDSVIEKIHKALNVSEQTAFEGATGILNTILPDNPSFTVDDAADWERRLAIITNAATPLSDRMLAIQRKYASPGDIPARQHYLYIQGQLQASGFDVYVHENFEIYKHGSPWVSAAAAADNSWESIAFGNDRFVAVSSGGEIMTSDDDGANWVLRTEPNTDSWKDITYGNNLFVAVASSGAGGRVMTSPDGITWTERTASQANAWQSVIYGNSIFVAVSQDGTNRVMTSPDGITWTNRNASAQNAWQSVTFGSNLFVAVAQTGGADNNLVMTSPDGITWTGRSIPASLHAGIYEGVVYGNNTFVAVSRTGGSERSMSSADGITWVGSESIEPNSWVGVTFGNNLFVTASTNTGDSIATSIDGINWTPVAPPENNNWQRVTFGNNTFVSISNDGINRVMRNVGQLSYQEPSDFRFYQDLVPLQLGQFQLGQRTLAQQTVDLVANSINPLVDSQFSIGADFRTIFFISAETLGDSADVPVIRREELRQLILTLKPLQMKAVLFINYT